MKCLNLNVGIDHITVVKKSTRPQNVMCLSLNLSTDIREISIEHAQASWSPIPLGIKQEGGYQKYMQLV